MIHLIHRITHDEIRPARIPPHEIIPLPKHILAVLHARADLRLQRILTYKPREGAHDRPGQKRRLLANDAKEEVEDHGRAQRRRPERGELLVAQPVHVWPAAEFPRRVVRAQEVGDDGDALADNATVCCHEDG